MRLVDGALAVDLADATAALTAPPRLDISALADPLTAARGAAVSYCPFHARVRARAGASTCSTGHRKRRFLEDRS